MPGRNLNEVLNSMCLIHFWLMIPLSLLSRPETKDINVNQEVTYVKEIKRYFMEKVMTFGNYMDFGQLKRVKESRNSLNLNGSLHCFRKKIASFL